MDGCPSGSFATSTVEIHLTDSLSNTPLEIAGSTCAGHAHAFRGMGCEGDGVAEGIKRSKHKEGRVDFAEKDGWRGTQIAGCSSKAVFTPSKDLQCPR